MSAHVFQTGPGSSAYYNVLLVQLVGESFNAYETTTSSLAFPTSGLKNKSLQRELCHIEVQCIIMVFFLRSASCAAELELSSKWGNFKED
jgi:hypothetical protein